MSMIRIKNLHKSFGDVEVLKGINLTVNESEVVCLIGSSGSGKSTLLGCINFLEKKTTGEIWIDEELVKEKKINCVRQKVGMVFQHFDLFPHMTVIQNVMEGPITVKKMPKNIARVLAMDLLEKVDLKEKANEYPDMLSGGQQQRTAVARSLIMNPKIVLADEPTGNLDSETTELVYDTLRDINKKFKTTFIIITHDRKIAEKTDRIVEIKDGRINLDLKR